MYQFKNIIIITCNYFPFTGGAFLGDDRTSVIGMNSGPMIESDTSVALGAKDPPMSSAIENLDS